MTIEIGIRRRLREWLLKGNNVCCPCCGKQFFSFWAFGKPVRFNSLCPGCGALERHRLISLFLSQRRLLTVDKEGKAIRLLHIAPEKTFFKRFRNHKDIRYYPADKFMDGYKYPRGTKNIDICNIHFPDNYFNAILCNHVLEHVPDDKQAMKELYRVLQSGGWAILQVPINYSNAATLEDKSIDTLEKREKYYGQRDHLRLYGRDYPDRLRETGFEVEAVDFCSTFSSDEKLRYGLDEKDGILFLCKKNDRQTT